MALIYVTETRARADLAVNVTDNRVNADLFVYEVASRDLAVGRDELWCQVDNSAIADVTVLLVESDRGADLVIHHVSNRDLAGWRRPHEWQEKLAKRG